MKKIYPIHTLFFILIIGIFAQSTLAQGLLGKRYISLSIGQQRPGDDALEEINDTIFLLGGDINVPVGSNVDASLSLAYSKLDGDLWGVDNGEAKPINGKAVGLTPGWFK